MLLPRIISFLCVVFMGTATLADKAAASLYGFNHYNPYTKEERILNLKEVPMRLKNYRAAMRNNLLMLIRYAREKNPDFKIVAHEGQDLLTKSLWEYSHEGYNRARKFDGADDDYFLFQHQQFDVEPILDTPAYEYLHSLDAIVLNNVYCDENKTISSIAKKHHLDLISIEYCPSEEALNEAKISAIADKRSIYGFTDLAKAFNTIGEYSLIDDSSKNVYNVSDAQNILILNDDSLYHSQEDLADDISKTNYDIVIIKPLFHYRKRFSPENLQKMRFKKNGTKRLLLAEFNVSEANVNEYYWDIKWRLGSPAWLARPSFSNADGIITQYWDSEWKKIISRYFKDLLNEGFDGVFFTGIENHQYFEQQNPLE